MHGTVTLSLLCFDVKLLYVYDSNLIANIFLILILSLIRTSTKISIESQGKQDRKQGQAMHRVFGCLFQVCDLNLSYMSIHNINILCGQAFLYLIYFLVVESYVLVLVSFYIKRGQVILIPGYPVQLARNWGCHLHKI